MEEEQVCPRCGSTDTGHDPVSVLSRLSLDESRHCNACGYTGIFPLVADEDMEEFRAEVEEQEVVDTEQRFNRGRFAIGLVMMVMGAVSTAHATWDTGLLAGMLALAVGAAVVFEQLSSRMSR